MSPEQLEAINRCYDGEREIRDGRIRTGGSYLAGIAVQECDGFIIIENCDEPPYTVRTTVALPLF